jgi:hypothetical protein
MARKLFCALFVMTVAITFVAADEFQATITKVDGNKVTYQKYQKTKKGEEKKKDGDPVTLSAKGAMVVSSKFDKETKKFVDGDAVTDGLKNEMFTTKLDEKKGQQARITTEGEGDKAKITKISVNQKKKKAAQ